MGTPYKLKLLLTPVKRVSPFKSVPKVSPVGALQYITPTKWPQEKHKVKLCVNDEEIEPKYSPKKRSEILSVNTPNRQSIFKQGLPTGGWNVLGKGSFGTVVQGIYKGELVAVKIIKHKPIERETNALKLDHENIVKTMQVLNEERTNYSLILMECLVDWVELQRVINDSDVELKVPRVAFDICKGLKYCHESGLMHLDLKPANILVYRGLSCKICDFGNSLKVGEDASSYEHKGTVLYTAPEILMGKSPSTKSDIYSLGLILWQLRHRERPFCDFSDSQVLIYKVVKFNLRPITTNAKWDPFFDLYRRCWEEDPQNRPDASEVFINLSRML